jgi:hypothetical protein
MVGGQCLTKVVADTETRDTQAGYANLDRGSGNAPKKFGDGSARCWDYPALAGFAPCLVVRSSINGGMK